MNALQSDNRNRPETFETVYESELRTNAINMDLFNKKSSHLNKQQSSGKSLVYPSQNRFSISETWFYNGKVRKTDYLKEHLLKNRSSAISSASSSSLRSGTMGMSSSGVTGSSNDSFTSNASSDIIITKPSEFLLTYVSLSQTNSLKEDTNKSNPESLLDFISVRCESPA